MALMACYFVGKKVKDPNTNEWTTVHKKVIRLLSCTTLPKEDDDGEL